MSRRERRRHSPRCYIVRLFFFFTATATTETYTLSLHDALPIYSPLAFVLSGGGARGAYEVGVLRYILGKLTPRLGDSARPRIFSGTSVGAINACAVASHHDLPDFAVGQLCESWRQLGLEQVFRLGWGDLAGLMRWLVGSAV